MKKITDSELIDKYLPVIKSYYPDINPKTITVFREGYDHDVLVVNEKDAFRFPRTSEQQEKDQIENKFLHIFEKSSPLNVQRMKSQTDPATGQYFQRYPFISGIPLTQKIAHTFTQQELVCVARDIGRFLKQLHTFPLVRARAINMDELDPKMYWQFFEDQLIKMRKTMFSLLTGSERVWIATLMQDYMRLTRANPFAVTVTHSDLLAEHIIIDKKTHALNGVIDFSLRITDPAIDFAYFDRYDPLFLKTVYEHYPPTDAFFDQRRKFYAGHVPIINLHESLEKQDVKMTKLHLLQLKKYISQNPFR